MRRIATILLASVFLMLSAMPAIAQEEDPIDVTIRQINELRPENLNTLKQRGADLTNDEVESLIQSAYTNQLVRFTAVVLSDPRKSGLASPLAGTGQPGRVHIFVRDVAAETEGPAGMNAQIVDASWETTGSGMLFIGDVIEVTGNVTYFGNTQQLDVETLTLIGNIDSEGIDESILDPVLTTTDEIMVSLGELSTQPDWDRFSDFLNQFVRIEGATVWRSPNRRDDRPNYTITSDNARTFMHSDDASLRYRNDRAGYHPDFDKREQEDRFVAPPAGAEVNIQGFVLPRGIFEATGAEVATPPSSMMRIIPWTDEDLVITAFPLITDIEPQPLEGSPGDGPVEIEITYEGERSDIVEATLYYTATGGTAAKASNDGEQSVSMTIEDGRIRGTIPAQEDGTFVTYRIVIEDVEGREYETTRALYRVMHDGVTRIRFISERPDGLRGRSPFVGQTLDMNITAIVMNDPLLSGFIAIQDVNGGPFGGAILQNSSAVLGLNLQAGDRIRITRGFVRSVRGDFVLTQAGDVPAIGSPVVEKLESGAVPEPILLTTGMIHDTTGAAAHIGMLVRFEDVTITDAGMGFGEWAFASADEAPLVADDVSSDISSTFANTTFDDGDRLSYIQGVLAYGFGNWRIVPRDLTDIGPFVETSNEDELSHGFALAQNYPNPFNPTTRIEFVVPAGGHATLEVFDMLGRHVATLVDNVIAAGRHHATFEANHLSSGLYVYRLTTGQHTISRTMMLVK